MKITIITSEYSVEGGGLSYSCRQFHHLLEELEHDVAILSSEVNEKNVIHGGYNKDLGKDLAYEAKLKQDVLNIRTSQLLIAFGGGFNAYYSALLSLKSNTRLWVMFRGSDGNLAKWNAKTSFLISFTVSVAEKVICLSKELADNIKLLTAKNIQIDVVPNHVLKIENCVKPLPKGHLHVGCGATHMNEKKGIGNLIELVAAYNEKYEEGLDLDIVGDIDSDVLTQYLKKAFAYGVQTNINFIGAKSRSDFHKIQQSWDMYIQTSICEGMGNSVTDSMSMGLPVMISNTGFVAELAKDYFPQMVFTTNDPNVIANEINAVVNDKTICNKYKQFYDAFFDIVSLDSVKMKWNNLLSSESHDNRHSLGINGILSVSLHDVSGDTHDNITTPIMVFKQFCEDVARAGYRLCSMKDYLSIQREGRNRYIVCTFDDGYVGLLKNAIPIMNKYGFTATVFVCTDYIGKDNYWNFKDKTIRKHLSVEELNEILACGWEIGSHGVTHRSLLRLNDEEILFELRESKHILESMFGQINSYAYPYGDYNEYVLKIVKRYYNSAFLLTQGGVFLDVDSLRIHRYYISEINQILKLNHEGIRHI